MTSTQPNHSSFRQLPPLQLAFPLPSSPDANLHIHLTAHAQSLVLFLHTSSTIISAAATANLGSFVYALPDLHPDSQPLSTPLYSSINTVDFATRVAKILVKKSGKPVYVGVSDTKFWAPEDESIAIRAVLDIVVEALRRAAR